MNRILDSNGINEVSARSPLFGLFVGKESPLELSQCLIPITTYFSREGQHSNNANIDNLTTAASVAGDMAAQLKSKTKLKVCQELDRSSLEKLSREEIAAICLYTFESGPYQILNDVLRNNDRNSVKPFVDYLWLLMHALSKCPRPLESVVYRGIRGHVSDVEYIPGNLVVWPAFSSCTTLCSVLTKNETFLGVEGMRTQFHITLTTNRARSIVHVSSFSNESEVLLPPNTRLRVIDVSDHGNGLVIILLKEEPCFDPILPFRDDLSTPPSRAAAHSGKYLPLTLPTLERNRVGYFVALIWSNYFRTIF